MRSGVAIHALSFTLLAGGAARAETLAQLLAREAISFRPAQPADLDREVTSGHAQTSGSTRVLATYVNVDGSLSGPLYVFRRVDTRWRSAELRWPEDLAQHCQGGSIVRIVEVPGFVFLEGHRNPSTSCTLVLTSELAFHDTVYGMPATALGELLVYQHSQVHFAPTHPLEVSIYDPGSRRRTRLFPRPDARLHPGEATLAESAADANGDALALHVRLDAEGGDDSDLLYVYRHVSRSARGAPIEVRELALGDAAARFGPGPLQRYLARDAVGSLFRGPAERPQAD